MGSLVLLKPDAFDRKLTGEITHRLHEIGTVCRMKLVPSVTYELLDLHYAEHVNKLFYPDLVEAMVGKQMLAIHIYGDTLRIREECLKIRAMYLDPDYVGPKNLIHSSDSEVSAEREIYIWFEFWDKVVKAVLPARRDFDLPVEPLDL